MSDIASSNFNACNDEPIEVTGSVETTRGAGAWAIQATPNGLLAHHR
jgi:hypothetical protein